MTKLTKAETIALIADKSGSSKAEVARVLDAAADVVAEQVAAGQSLPLVGGIFEPRHREARQGRNPQTGEAITIDAKNSVAFKAGSALKAALN